MKKKYFKILYSLAIVLLIAFFVFVFIDYINYDPIFTSAPFYVNILIRGIEFLFPCFICFILIIYKRRNEK